MIYVKCVCVCVCVRITESTISTTIAAEKYTGFVSVTTSGHVCQAWVKQQPHEHKLNDSDFAVDASLAAAKNYCRDPSLSGYLWCYTTDPGVRWDICTVDLTGKQHAPTPDTG